MISGFCNFKDSYRREVPALLNASTRETPRVRIFKFGEKKDPERAEINYE